MPSCHSFLKLDRTPIEKNVRMKKITLNVLASPIAAGTFEATSAGGPSARERPTRNVTTKPRMNFGKRCQISAILAFSDVTLIWLGRMVPSSEAPQTREKSRDTFHVAGGGERSRVDPPPPPRRTPQERALGGGRRGHPPRRRF